jgi:hypothetical protein
MNTPGGKRITGTVLAAIALGFAGSGALAGGFLDIEFEDATFLVNPLLIDNDYWPLNPSGGTSVPLSFTYTAETDDECVLNTLFVNSGLYGSTGQKTITVEIDGVPTMYTALEVLDIEWIQDECMGDFEESEVTLDWYAQDDVRNIWYMGELSRSFDAEDGCDGGVFDPTTPTNTDDECYAGSWEAGVTAGEGEDAVTGIPGIVVPSNHPFGVAGEPLENGTHYMQEVAFEAEDMAKILKLSTSLSVEDGIEPGEYEECRKVKEWNPYEPGGSVEHKWYCADGAGLVLIEGIGGGSTDVETLVEVGP